MLTAVLSWIVVLILSVVFILLAARAWRSRKLAIRLVGGILASLLAAILAVVAVTALVGFLKFRQVVTTQVPAIQVEGTPEQVARGEDIADFFCATCHSTTSELPLTGGMDLGNDFPLPLGSFVSANLTPVGQVASMSDGELFNAIRNGVGTDGRFLTVMSGANGRKLSDEDILAVIAYLRSQPPTGEPIKEPLDQPTLLGYVMFGAGMFPPAAPPSDVVITAPPIGPTVEYGEYILSYQDCRLCHGADLTGGVEGQLAPIGPSLRVVKGWTQEGFMATFRTGVNPDGYALGTSMPWRNFGRMSDDELIAIYAYIQQMP